ncbi:DUF554 domain-containing protein [Clostridium folliculivorans]|uniref:Membrane protein n=1 Tax=Clostridium folliculivorans TaxID=2886038 RepID=A0A9W5XZ81_9CLOT|nr:DUF554 domain-containing protein [Clostridium folliculivorans]GKU23799.1 membrane protein [Clostridium folliculivorans]GKU29915.1 membrane protein [Clostridium folliculivorans]
MLGTLVNFGAIVIGGILGLLLKGGIPERLSKTIMNGLALCVLYIGISGALKGDNPLLIIISIAVGALIGELIDIDNLLSKFGVFIEEKFKKITKNSPIAEGFVTSSLLFCVGAMAIVGSLQSGLEGNHTVLFNKSILDGISSIVFASSLGIGVIFSAFAVLIYQGSITLLATLIQGILTTTVINSMTAVGSLLIIGLSFNMLGITKIKVANLLPAIIIPMIYSFFA